MADPAEEVSFTNVLEDAKEEIDSGLFVTEVDSVWAPTVISDKNLAKGIAERLALLITRSGAEVSEDEMQRLVDFGTAVGALSLRNLFNPFVSDEIWVEYREGSNLTQHDAVRRVSKGIGHPHGAAVISTILPPPEHNLD